MWSIKSLPWYAIWLKAITQPSLVTYIGIGLDPRAKRGRALLWIFLASCIAVLISQAPWVIGSDRSAYLSSNRPIAIIVIPILAVLFLAAAGAAIQWGATHLLQIDQSSEKVIFVLAAILAPASILGGMLSSIGYYLPFQLTCWLHSAAFGYIILLQIIAIQAVYSIERIHAVLLWALGWLFLLPAACLATAIYLFINPSGTG